MLDSGGEIVNKVRIVAISPTVPPTFSYATIFTVHSREDNVLQRSNFHEGLVISI